MKKIRKIYRYYRARLQPRSALPFFWHTGHPNFGDDINPSFFRAALDQAVRLEIHRDRPHFLGMGSILQKATSVSTVVGSGFLVPPAPCSLTPERVISVRGKLSLAGLTRGDNVLLGDPMVLLNLVAPIKADRNGPVGLVPHVSEVNKAKRMMIPGVKIIDPQHSPWRVIHEIAGCSRIFSQSLHGLIVADALDIPNIWIEPSDQMMGADFKFNDYFSTLDSEKKPFQFKLETFAGSSSSAFSVGRYKYDKKLYLDTLREGVSP